MHTQTQATSTLTDAVPYYIHTHTYLYIYVQLLLRLVEHSCAFLCACVHFCSHSNFQGQHTNSNNCNNKYNVNNRSVNMLLFHCSKQFLMRYCFCCALFIPFNSNKIILCQSCIASILPLVLRQVICVAAVLIVIQYEFMVLWYKYLTCLGLCVISFSIVATRRRLNASHATWYRLDDTYTDTCVCLLR